MECLSSKACLPLAVATPQRQDAAEACHGDLACGTVRFVLDRSVLKPTEKDTAMLQVSVRDRLLFKLLTKALVFTQYSLMLSCKPIVFVLETLQLFPELDDPLLLDGG